MPLVGVPRLQHLCIALLIDFRDCLDDVGDTPLELLQPVLLRCNAEQLASIEDGTRNGGRELHDALQSHWHRVYTADFGAYNRAFTQGLHNASDSPRGVTCDWRQLYELGQDALQEKAAGLGKRLRAMTQAEVQARQTRSVEIIEAPPSQKRHRSSSSRGQSKPKVQIIPARQRGLSKLGLLHSSSLKQLVQIRPPRLPGQCERANHSKAAHCPVRGAESRQQSNTCRVAVKRDANSPQAATSSKLSSKSRPVPQRGNSVTDPGSLISRQQGVRAQAPVRVPKEECTPSGQLVEDDIEWGASEAAQACATVLPHVASEQPWTVQYLEGHQVDTARDQMLGRHVSCGHLFTQKSQLPSGSKTSDVLGDKAQVKHGTGIAGWVEDEIQWD